MSRHLQTSVVALETAATLSYLGVPEREHREFMELVESYRSAVVATSNGTNAQVSAVDIRRIRPG